MLYTSCISYVLVKYNFSFKFLATCNLPTSLFSLKIRSPMISTLFPYTTLFRSMRFPERPYPHSYDYDHAAAGGSLSIEKERTCMSGNRRTQPGLPNKGWHRAEAAKSQEGA